MHIVTSVVAADALQFVARLGGEERACAADRMTQRDRTAVRVNLTSIK